MLEKQNKRHRRHKRIRSKIEGTGDVPRLCIFRSNQHTWAQLINDQNGTTLVASNDIELEKQGASVNKNATKAQKAQKVGEAISKKAQDKKIKRVVFDRAGYKYHGRVKAVKEGAEKKGLSFQASTKKKTNKQQ